MHFEYMGALHRLNMLMAFFETYASGPMCSPRFVLKNKTAELISFDREIVLAQRRHDMAASQLNQPHGDSNDMSSNPKFVHLDGQLYVSAQALAFMHNFTHEGGGKRGPGVRGEGRSGWFEHNIGGHGFECSEEPQEVIVKPDDSQVIGTLKYKVELDTSNVTELLDKLRGVIGDSELGKDLRQKMVQGEAIFSPGRFSILNNGTIIINQAAIDDGTVHFADLSK